MDNQEDFLFLQEHITERFNPLAEGEYIVIQTRTGSWRLHPLLRTFSYWQAENRCNMENMGADYSHYSVRIVQDGKLHRVDMNGYASQLSKEQDWQIQQEYWNARYIDKDDCEIETCPCSYPVFWSWRQVSGAGNQMVRDWRPVTCLVQDHEREVRHCPNCNAPLLSLLDEDIDPPDTEDEADWWDWEEVPEMCKGCQYYNDNHYISCTIHPNGAEEEVCPDYCPQ